VFSPKFFSASASSSCATRPLPVVCINVKKLHSIASSYEVPTVSVDDFEYKLSDFFSRVVGPVRIIGPIFHLKATQ
jgi:hypothetical protein